MAKRVVRLLLPPKPDGQSEKTVSRMTPKKLKRKHADDSDEYHDEEDDEEDEYYDEDERLVKVRRRAARVSNGTKAKKTGMYEPWDL